MASKTIYLTELVETNGNVSAIDLSSSVDPTLVNVLRYADQTKYAQVTNTGSALFSHELEFLCAYSAPFINPLATIDSIVVTLIKSQTYIGVTAKPFYMIFSIGDQTNSVGIFPVNTAVGTNPPTTWETHTVTMTEDDAVRPWLVGQLLNGIRINLYTFGAGPTSINHIDQVYITINYTNPVPTLGTMTLEQAWMNHFEVYTPISLTDGAVTTDYPLTYYYEWTTQDPSLATPTVTSTSTPVVMTRSANRELSVGGSKNIYFAAPTSTIPDNFSFVDSTTYLGINKNYWVRFIVTYEGITYTGSWAAMTTASVDRIGI